MGGDEELLGEGYDEEKIQFEPCKYRNQKEEGTRSNDWNNGYDKKCKYMDNNGNCIFENCLYDQEETPPQVLVWNYECVICRQPASIVPKHMKIHWCPSCIRRANEVEVLPFTCRFCGRRQKSPSAWFFSGVCDSCIDKLYNPNHEDICKNWEPIGSY